MTFSNIIVYTSSLASRPIRYPCVVVKRLGLGHCARCCQINATDDDDDDDELMWMWSVLQVVLPEYFEPWNQIGLHVAELVATRKLRDAVHKVEYWTDC